MRNALAVIVIGLAACGGSNKAVAPPAPTPSPSLEANGHLDQHITPPSDMFTTTQPPTCGGAPMTVKFYNAGQALAALVTLPDGKHILVDAGESPKRPGCSQCKDWHQRVMDGLAADLDGAPIDMLWITHLHSDHLGGVPDVEDSFKVSEYVDNGRTPAKDKPTSVVHLARDAAKKSGTSVVTVDQSNAKVPFSDSGVTLTAIVPPEWLDVCDTVPDENMCSIALRIDYCSSSVLFTGDMGEDEEAQSKFDQVTLLQVGHHGSYTASSEPFLAQVQPKYAVISSGLPDEGTNLTYCHPRAETVTNVTKALGGAGSQTIKSYEADKCIKHNAKGWVETPASDNLWATSRDGDITLTTTGDGVFTKQ